MYDDDVPPEDPLRTYEAEASEEPTGKPLSGPLNASPSSSISGPQVEGEISKNIDSTNEQSPGPELLSDAPTANPAQDNISTQDQQPSAQSTNALVHRGEGDSNDQPQSNQVDQK